MGVATRDYMRRPVEEVEHGEPIPSWRRIADALRIRLLLAIESESSREAQDVATLTQAAAQLLSFNLGARGWDEVESKEDGR